MPRPHGVRAQDYAAEQAAKIRGTAFIMTRAKAEEWARELNTTVELLGKAIERRGGGLLIWETFEWAVPCTCSWRPYPHSFSNDEYGHEARMRHNAARNW